MAEPLETIVALATPPGTSALGLVRLSGTRTSAILSRALRLPRGVSGLHHRRAQVAWLVDPADDRAIDEVIVTFFAGPRSFTGEDLAEVGIHGSPRIVAEALGVFQVLGARPARPGEFTRRAVIHGKLDVTRAEAILELIGAESSEAAKLAARHLEGEVSNRYRRLRDELIRARGQIEGVLEFPDEVGADAVSALEDAASSVAILEAEIGRWIASGALAERITGGFEVLIVGRPNVGKSSLLNRLSESDRAIVSPRPGTTRDLVEASMSLAGVLARLVDSAGLTAPAGDEIEAEGMRRTSARLASCDLALLVLDAEAGITQDDLALWRRISDRPALVVLNKVDLVDGSGGDRRGTWRATLGQDESTCVVEVSAKTGEGLDELRHALAIEVSRLTHSTRSGGESPITSIRQRGLLERAATELGRAVGNLGMALTELAAEDLRSAESFLDELIEPVLDEEILDQIFRHFCIGK